MRQSWIIGFTFIALVVFILLVACVCLLCCRVGDEVDPEAVIDMVQMNFGY
jgi:hypothetical protein